MRPGVISSTLFGLSLLVSVAACSGSTDTVAGTGASGSPSGKAPGSSGADGAGGRASSDPSRGESNGGTDRANPSDSPANDPSDTNDPSDPNATSGVDGVIEVPQATGSAASGDFVLSQSKKAKRIDIAATNLTCPVTLASTQAPYVYVELKNTGTKRALTSVWTTTSGSSPANTADALTVYPGATPPATDAAREECLGSVSWSCSGGPCTGWPGLSSTNGDAVEVPATGSVLIFVQGEPAKTGSFKLNVRTDFLQ